MAAMLARARAGVIGEAFIGGSWSRPMGKGVLTIVNPANSSEVLTSAACSDMDVNLSVQAARDAFVAWSGSSFERRREVLRAAADGIEAAKQDLAALESLNTGKPLREAEGDMDECITAFRHCATMTEKLEKESEVGQGDLGDGLSGTIRKEPLGVVAGVCPWNYPAMMAAWKIAPALAAVCTIVIKPSELTPFTTLALAKVLEEAGLPAGCLSVLPGGKSLGASLVGHPDIDKVSFTGSSQAGVSVMCAAAARANPVTLELGGECSATAAQSGA
jgi:betaine-aldehyde dehydrogenase